MICLFCLFINCSGIFLKNIYLLFKDAVILFIAFIMSRNFVCMSRFEFCPHIVLSHCCHLMRSVEQ
jgi:hypothetical protein